MNKAMFVLFAAVSLTMSTFAFGDAVHELGGNLSNQWCPDAVAGATVGLAFNRCFYARPAQCPAGTSWNSRGSTAGCVNSAGQVFEKGCAGHGTLNGVTCTANAPIIQLTCGKGYGLVKSAGIGGAGLSPGLNSKFGFTCMSFTSPGWSSDANEHAATFY